MHRLRRLTSPDLSWELQTAAREADSVFWEEETRLPQQGATAAQRNVFPVRSVISIQLTISENVSCCHLHLHELSLILQAPVNLCIKLKTHCRVVTVMENLEKSLDFVKSQKVFGKVMNFGQISSRICLLFAVIVSNTL